jgi:hypothetical protein
MASPEMIAMLQKRRQELLRELQAIDVLLAGGHSENKTATNDLPKPEPYNHHLGYLSTRDQHIALLHEKTDAISWKEYTHKAIQILGAARGKAISDLIIDANDHKIPDSRVRDSVTAALNALVKEKKVNVKTDEEKKKVFFID